VKSSYSSKVKFAARRPLRDVVSKKVGCATAEYNMIEDGDRILVAVSGGKDSLVLLKLLSDRRAFVPIDYSLVAVHVELSHQKTDKDRLKEFFQKQECEFHFRKLVLRKDTGRRNTPCFWCSWNRRKVLFESAKELRCNKIALGHNKDDIVQTVLMNLLFEGQISAMVPRQEMFKGKIVIIRPLAYVQEEEIQALAQEEKLPVCCAACPNSQTSKRALVAKFINELSDISPGVKTNIFQSIRRVKKDYLL